MNPNQTALLDSMTHHQVVQHVLTTAEQHAWNTYAPRTTKTHTGNHLTPYEQTPHATGKGFPDITCIGMCWVLFIEIKTGKGRLEPDQRRWQDAALAVEEHGPDSRVLHVVLRPTGIPAMEAFLTTGQPQHLIP